MDTATYRLLYVENDWPFFDPDCKIPERDRALIWPLSLASAGQFWEAYVSPKALERHPMLLPNGHWPAPTVQGPSWLTEQSPGHFAWSAVSNVESFLNGSFCLDSSERVYFVLMKERLC